jgi:alanine racemase
MRLFSYIRRLVKPAVIPLNTISLYQSIALRNLSLLQQARPHDAIFPVVKSNAYGHGLKEVSTILADSNVPYLCIDSFPEYQIVKAFARKKSLVLWETLPENYRAYNPHRATFGIYNIDALRALIALGRNQSIHLFINTWMHREGIDLHQLPAILAELALQDHVRVEWVMSHLSDADEESPRFLEQQCSVFEKALVLIRQAGHRPTYVHIGNSAGWARIQNPPYNAWRTGLAFYGYDLCHRADTPLRPWLDFTSTVISCHHLDSGQAVGYSWTYITPHPLWTITLPVGYKEGVPRHAQEHHHVVRNHQKLSCAGRVSMNLSSYASQTPIPLYSTIMIYDHKAYRGTMPWSLGWLAQRMGTIPYTLMVALDPTIHRSIVVP